MRLPAEWEENQSVIIALPHASTDWLPIIDEVKKCYAGIIKAIAPQCNILVVSSDIIADTLMLSGDVSIDRSRLFFLSVPTNDTWTRDYGFITTVDSDGNYYLNDFKFNGWGLKFAADKDNLVNRQITGNNVLVKGNYINR